LPLAGFELALLVVIGTDGTGSWISNYHTITTTNPPCTEWSLMQGNILAKNNLNEKKIND
jgi:hypothetical protein